MSSASPVPSSRRKLVSAGVSAIAAVVALVWTVGLAVTTVAPWTDSPAAVYALVADVLLGVGTLTLAFAVAVSRSRIVRWRFPRWLEPFVYVASCIAVAIPLAVSATNSFGAAAIGEGDPSPILIILGGVGLAAMLAFLMRRGIWLGLVASVVLGGALTAVALHSPH